MLFFGIKNLWFRLGIVLLLTIPMLFFIARMHHDYTVADPYDPALIGTAAYGHNANGSFETNLKLTLIEYAVLLIVLLPFSFSRFYWARLIVLQMLFVAWFLLMAVAGMHAGGVHAIHTIWLLTVNILIFVLFIASIFAEIKGRKKLSSPAD